MWVKFTDRFRWKPTPQSTQFYDPGVVANVTRGCGEAAIAAGKAEQIEAPKDAPAAPAKKGKAA